VDFEAAGSHAFAPFGDGKPMAYWSAPAEALDDQDILLAPMGAEVAGGGDATSGWGIRATRKKR
jgi:hypothetical protein